MQPEIFICSSYRVGYIRLGVFNLCIFSHGPSNRSDIGNELLAPKSLPNIDQI